MNITAGHVREAAERLLAANGPVLGFSFDTSDAGITIDFNEHREIAELCLEALAQELSAVVEGQPRLEVVRG